MEFFSGFWITRFRHFKWNSSSEKNRLFQSTNDKKNTISDIKNLISINNYKDIKSTFNNIERSRKSKDL